MSAQGKFAGFPAQGIAFLAGLAANNDRNWFKAREDEYRRYVKEPAAALEAAVAERLGRLLGRAVGSKTFRIHRDVRFSKDKSPYNTHVRLSFWEDSAAEGCRPGYHLSIEPDRFVTGAGAFVLGDDDLQKFRDAVGQESSGAKLVKLLDRLAAEGFDRHPPELARVPRGFAADHPRAALLRHKGLSVWQSGPHPAALGTERATEPVMAAFKTLRPLVDWLGRL